MLYRSSYRDRRSNDTFDKNMNRKLVTLTLFSIVSFSVDVVCLLGYSVTELMTCHNWTTRWILPFVMTNVDNKCFFWWWDKLDMPNAEWTTTSASADAHSETKLKSKHFPLTEYIFFDVHPRFHFIKMTIIRAKAFVCFRLVVSFYDDIIESSTLSSQFCVALWCKFS